MKKAALGERTQTFLEQVGQALGDVIIPNKVGMIEQLHEPLNTGVWFPPLMNLIQYQVLRHEAASFLCGHEQVTVHCGDGLRVRLQDTVALQKGAVNKEMVSGRKKYSP
jgi:hypothetical protein